jgi:hypothetical protein
MKPIERQNKNHTTPFLPVSSSLFGMISEATLRSEPLKSNEKKNG